MKPKFHNASGTLTDYALGCGYLEKRTDGKIETTLWKEHGVYHVRQHEFDGRGRIFWDTYHTLTEARKRFKGA